MKMNLNEQLKRAMEKDNAKGLERGDHFVGYYYELYNKMEEKENE